MPRIDKIEKKAKDWLKKNLSRSSIVFAKKDIEENIYKYLSVKDFCAEINRQYIFLKSANESLEQSFITNFWQIIFQFLDLSFPEGWYFTGNYAYKFAVDNLSISSNKISIATAGKSNRILKLPNSIEIVCSYDKDFKNRKLQTKSFFATNIHTQKNEALLINATNADYQNYKEELLALIKSSDRDEAYIINYFKQNSSPVLLARLIAALKQTEDFTLRLELEELYKVSGASSPIKNPFDAVPELNIIERPAYLARFEISLAKAYKQLSKMKKPRRLSRKINTEDLDRIAIEDGYHSLTIEGYTVTKALLASIQQDKNYPGYSELKDQVAAKGFINVLNYLKKIVDSKFKINETLSRKIYEELWKPSINAGIIKAELDIYRKHMVAIRGSHYVPPAHGKISYLIDELFDFASQIDNGFDLGIFLHYFYVSIHPHSDGNGRISRFLMNLSFIQDKYSWLTINSSLRGDYFQALQKSQIEDDISYFADFIAANY